MVQLQNEYLLKSDRDKEMIKQEFQDKMLELEANTLQHLENTQTTISAQLHRAVKKTVDVKMDMGRQQAVRVGAKMDVR